MLATSNSAITLFEKPGSPTVQHLVHSYNLPFVPVMVSFFAPVQGEDGIDLDNKVMYYRCPRWKQWYTFFPSSARLSTFAIQHEPTTDFLNQLVEEAERANQ